jgi:hypothetical protein
LKQQANLAKDVITHKDHNVKLAADDESRVGLHQWREEDPQ